MLTIYAPPNKPESKCWNVFRPLLNGGWPDVEVVHNYELQDNDGICWGFVGCNEEIMRVYAKYGEQDFYFADMPYFGRWSAYHEAVNPGREFYWRIIKNGVHMSSDLKDYPNDRWDAHNLDLHEWNDKGDHILVCPSSVIMTKHHYTYDDHTWTEGVVAKLKQHTDREIRIRQKPRGKGTSGPAAALIPFAADIKNAHAIVTSVSMSAVEAAILGVPGFCHPANAASAINLYDLGQIEKPIYPDRQKWLNNLCYNQFTPSEIQSGFAYKVLKCHTL